ncbi:hypothetical protein QZH41_019448, partial [Actinostola sp. cb2023]
DNHWPLTTIGTNGTLTDLSFHNNGSVQGDDVHDSHGVLSLTGSGHVAFDGFADDCLMDPAKCRNGFTVSFWIKLGGFISSILEFNTKYHTALDNWLARIVPSKSRWLPCYQASKHGWKGRDFRSNCGAKNSTLTIVKVRDYVLGGFLSVPWSSVGQSIYVNDPKAFLFSLNNPLGAEPFQLFINPQLAAKAASSSDEAMPSFGEGDLVLVDDANTSTQSTASPGSVYLIPSNITVKYSSNLFAGSSPFLVEEIEVFFNEALNSDQSYILTSGAEDPSTTGFTIYNKHPSTLIANVTANNKMWGISLENTSRAWHHVALLWTLDGGIKFYRDGSRLANDNLGTVSNASAKKTSLLLGSSASSPSSGQNIQMYGLTLWRHAIPKWRLINYKDMGKHFFDILLFSRSAILHQPQRTPSSAEIALNYNSLSTFTVCWRLRKDRYINGWGTVFHVKNTFRVLQLFQGSSVYFQFWKHVPSWTATTSFVISSTLSWHHYCLRINTSSIDVFIDGLYKELLYIESSYPRRRNDITRAVTSEYIPVHINCLSFKYYLNGKNIGRLNVYLRTNDMKESLIWSLAGDQVSYWWKTVYLPLKHSVKSKVVFEGIVGDGYLGDTAFAFVRLRTTASCLEGNGKSYTHRKGIKSRIIGHIKNYTTTLQEWLTKFNYSYWAPCYNLNKEGWVTSQKLHSRCANKGPTVFLVRYHGNVFGGFYDQPWFSKSISFVESNVPYGQCTSKTLLPSDDAFLFSLKSDAGSATLLPIRTRFHNQSLVCSDSGRYFPNFGNDLVLDLVSKNVKGTYGRTYGSTYGSTSGSFVTRETIVTPSDIEILVPQVRFCPTMCPQGMVCDEIKGSCICNKFSRLSEVCQTGIFVENFTSDAYDVFTFYFPADIKSLKRPVWGEVKGESKLTKGILRDTISTKTSSYVLINSTHQCLTDPSLCSTGITMSIWLRYFESGPREMLLFCSDSCLGTKTGIRISRSLQSDSEVLIISVTTTTKRCNRVIPGGHGVWTHIVLTMSSNNSVLIYKNGVVTQPLSEICVTSNYPINAEPSVIIGKDANVDVDLFIVWAKVVSSKNITDLHNIYKGRKNMTLTFMFTTTTSGLTNDQESSNYQYICSNVKQGITSIIPNNAIRPLTQHCSLSTAGYTTVVTLSMVYNKAGYDVAKPLIGLLKTGMLLGGRAVTNITNLTLDTVYTQACNITHHKVSDNTVFLEWDCGNEPIYVLLYGYEINTTESSTGVVTSATLASAYLNGTIVNLKYVSTYSIVVTAITVEGVGNPSLPITIIIGEKALDTAPWNITAETLNHFSINVTWEFLSLSVWPYIHGFRIDYNSTSKVNLVNVSHTITSYVMTSLTPLTTYQIAVRGYNLVGEGPASQTVQATTLVSPLTKSPDNVVATPLDTIVMVRWQIIPANAEFGPILGYIVNCTTVNATDKILNVSEAVVNITGLTTLTNYTIVVRGYTAVGPGPWSLQKVVSRPEGAPTAGPTNLIFDLINATTFNLKWNVINALQTNGIVRGYHLMAQVANGENAGKFMYIATCNTSVAFNDLYSFTDYHVNISGFTNVGLGVYAHVYVANQEKGPVFPPVLVRTTGVVGKTTMNITWNTVPEGSSNSPISGYAVMYRLYNQSQPNNTIMINDTRYLRLDGLTPYTMYEVRVAGVNRAGVGVFSPPFVVRTAEGVPNAVVSNASAGVITKNSTFLQWSPISASNLQGVLRGYIVTVHDALRGVNTTHFICASKNSLNLTQLFPYTSHSVYLSAFSGAGPGRVTKTTEFQTAESAPDAPPQNVTSHNTSSTGLETTWQPPPITNINGKLRGYFVIWFETLAVNPEIFNKTISTGKRRRRSVESSSSSQTLQLTGLKKFTMYTIRILAFTVEDGVIFQTNATTAEDVPNVPPPNITAHNTSSTTIAVAWQPIPEAFFHGIFRGYQVFYQRSDQPSLTPMVVKVDHVTLKAVIGNLSEYTTYDISVAGFTTPGTGNVSEILKVSTEEDVPDDSPLMLAGKGLNTTALSFTWQAITPDEQNGIILGYTLSLHRINESLVKTMTVNNGTALTTTTGGLETWFNYTVNISGFTVKGAGPWSSKVLVTTLEEVPLPPTNLVATVLSSTSIKVTWVASNTTFLRGILRHYRVLFTPRGSVFPHTTSNVTTTADSLSVQLNELHKYTEYDIVMTALTIADGNRSVPIIARTDSDVPSAGPSGLGLVKGSAYDMTIKVGPVPPRHLNGILTEYKVVLTKDGSSAPISEKLYGPTATMAFVDGLKPFTNYTFAVFASTDKGWSNASYMTLQTSEAAPDGQPANSIKPARFAVDSIPLKWAPVSEQEANGVVLGYRVAYQLVALGEEPIEDSPVHVLRVSGTAVNLTGLHIYGQYRIAISAYTERGDGPEMILVGETCRCRKTLYANWREYMPYVNRSNTTGAPEGILPQVITEMTGECCQDCVAHNISFVDYFTNPDGSSAIKYSEDDLKTNISEEIDFTFPMYGTMDQKTYPGGFGYRALIESPGIVFVVNIDQDFKGVNPDSPSKATINSIVQCLLYILVTLAIAYFAGFIMWLLVKPPRPPGVFPAILYQRYIRRIVVGLYYHDNTGTFVSLDIKPRSFQELYDALMQKKVYGALIDGYAIGSQKHLFEHPSLKFAKIYDVKPAYGIVLGGTSSRLRRCFYSYMQGKRAEIFQRISKYTKIIESVSV